MNPSSSPPAWKPVPQARFRALLQAVFRDRYARSADASIYGPLEDWDVSEIEDMSHAFSDAPKFFNADLSRWNTSRVTNMQGTFSWREHFNGDISRWDTSRVTNMEEMFYGTQAFNAPIGGWNTSQVTTMRLMFYDARAFNQPLGEWDVSLVTDMHGMFRDATTFNQPLARWGHRAGDRDVRRRPVLLLRPGAGDMERRER